MAPSTIGDQETTVGNKRQSIGAIVNITVLSADTLSILTVKAEVWYEGAEGYTIIRTEFGPRLSGNAASAGVLGELFEDSTPCAREQPTTYAYRSSGDRISRG